MNHLPTTEQVDPRTLVIGTNVRLDPRLSVDKQFLASVRERGVLEPVVAHHDAANDGALTVLYGQRRTLAAVHVGRETVPVYVVDSPAGEADRVIDQMAENDHRVSLSTAERLAGFEQLAALGLTAGQIAKRTATKRAEVDTALTVAGSQLAKAATDRYDFLTLDQSAVIADFEDDLVRRRRPGRRGRAVRCARTDRPTRPRAAVVADLTAAGVTVIDRPEWGATEMELSRLVDAETGQDLDGDGHATCPGHAAYLIQEWVTPESSRDHDNSVEDEDEDEDGYGTPVRAWVARNACTDPAANGHRDRYARSGAGTGATGGSGGTGRTPVAQMSETEREAARAERRDVIESNKAWDSAETVRLAWVKAFLTRKSAPKGSAAFVAAALASNPAMLSDHKAREVAAQAFGTTAATWGHSPIADLAAKASEARAHVITLGLVLTAYEAQTGRHSWRNVSTGTAAYLTFLAANGHTLAPVEERATGKGKRTLPKK